MFCLLDQWYGDIKGYIIASDVDELKAKALACGRADLEEEIARFGEFKRGHNYLKNGIIILKE